MILTLGLGAFAFDAADIDAAAAREIASAGQLVIVEETTDGGLAMVTGGTVIPASADKVWAQILDFESYATWMPDVAKVDILVIDPPQIDVAFQLQFKFSVISKKVNYTLRYVEEKPGLRMSWSALAGDMGTAIGSWDLVPLDDGAATLAFYSTYTDLSDIWMVKTIIKEQPTMDVAIQTSTAVTVVKALSDRVQATLEP